MLKTRIVTQIVPTNYPENISSLGQAKTFKGKLEKKFIYERQKHIRFVLVPPSHSEHSYNSTGKSFNFNYIWTFLWAKQ